MYGSERATKATLSSPLMNNDGAIAGSANDESSDETASEFAYNTGAAPPPFLTFPRPESNGGPIPKEEHLGSGFSRHKRRSKNWSRAETLGLIQARAELDTRFQKERGRRKSEVWEAITLALRLQRISRDARQCKDKWEKLTAAYKEVCLGTRSKDDFPYFDELHSLLSPPHPPPTLAIHKDEEARTQCCTGQAESTKEDLPREKEEIAGGSVGSSHSHHLLSPPPLAVHIDEGEGTHRFLSPPPAMVKDEGSNRERTHFCKGQENTKDVLRRGKEVSRGSGQVPKGVVGSSHHLLFPPPLPLAMDRDEGQRSHFCRRQESIKNDLPREKEEVSRRTLKGGVGSFRHLFSPPPPPPSAMDKDEGERIHLSTREDLPREKEAATRGRRKIPKGVVGGRRGDPGEKEGERERLWTEKDSGSEEGINRKRKVVVSLSELLESIVSQQQAFFVELIEAMDKVEQVREQARSKREEKWREEERVQRRALDDTMVLLAHKLLVGGDQFSPPNLLSNIPSSSPPPPPPPPPSQGGSKKRSKNWKRSEVLLLIELRGRMEAKFIKSTRRVALWDELAQELEAEGVCRDGKQCREKWDKLMADFKDVTDGRRDQSESPYFAELKAFASHPIELDDIHLPQIP